MKIKERLIADLNPAEYNPRQLTDKQYKQLKKSLKNFRVCRASSCKLKPNA